MYSHILTAVLLLTQLPLSAQEISEAPTQDHDSTSEDTENVQSERILIDTETNQSDSAKLYTADIVLANHHNTDYYPYIARKSGMSSSKINAVVKSNTQTQIPVVFYADWPALIPNNHLSDIKQFTLSLSTNQESGNWGLFYKAYDIQIDAYFSQQVGLQTVHCFVVSGDNATCNAYLEQAGNHMNIIIHLQ